MWYQSRDGRLTNLAQATQVSISGNNLMISVDGNQWPLDTFDSQEKAEHVLAKLTEALRNKVPLFDAKWALSFYIADSDKERDTDGY